MAFLNSLFGNARDPVRQDGAISAPPSELLGHQILSLTLTRIPDIFDADGLWSAQHTKKTAICDKESGSSRHRLYAHLKANKRKIHRQDPGSGRLLGLRRVYSDVVVQINRQRWAQEIRGGEPGFAILTTNLALRHRKDFKQDLKALNRTPRYVVAPAPDLAADEVRFLFGSGIFVPGEDDELIARLSPLDPTGTRFEVLDWEIYDHTGGMARRPVGLYAGQRSCFIRGPAGPSLIPHVARDWSQGDSGFVQLSRPPAADHWRAYDDGETCRCVEIEGEPYAGGRRYRFLDAMGRETLSLLLEPPESESNAPASSSTLPITEPGPGAARPAGLQPSHLLRLVGIALPGIHGARRVRRANGVDLVGWRLWLDSGGGLADLGQADPSRLAMVSTNAETGKLLVRHAGASELIEVEELPFRLRINPFSETDHATIARPAHDNYLGMVWLSQQPELVLAYADHEVPGSRWLGRAGGHPTPELCLDFLDQPGSLLWSGPELSGGSLGHLELSRQQLEAALDSPSDRLEITPPASGNPVSSFVLDPGFRLLATLKPGVTAWQLEPGHYLLLGCYLLRFEHLRSEAGASGEETILSGSSVDIDDERTLVAPQPTRAG